MTLKEAYDKVKAAAPEGYYIQVSSMIGGIEKPCTEFRVWVSLRKDHIVDITAASLSSAVDGAITKLGASEPVEHDEEFE